METTKSVQKCSEINDAWDSFFTERVSMILAKFFAKHNIRPNTVTLFSIISGVCGAVCLAFHNVWLTIAGILLEILAAIFDAADGQVARLTKKGSKFGRIFDGFGDGVVQTSIYLALCVRMHFDLIPFTNIVWGHWVIIPLCIIGIYFHTRQARVADYYKQIYMFMIRNGKGTELDNAESLKKEFENEKLNWLQKLELKSYISYTKTQQKQAPKTQLLLDEISKNNGVLPEKITEIYKENVKYAKLLNLLVFNLRTYTLFGLLIADLATKFQYGLLTWYMVLVLLIMEPFTIFLELKWEGIAKKAMKEGFNK